VRPGRSTGSIDLPDPHPPSAPIHPWYPSLWSTSAMGLMSPKHVVLGILIGYPATEVDLLIPSEPTLIRVRVSAPAPFVFSDLGWFARSHSRAQDVKLGQN
jgi:hypothetical protein